MSTTSTSLERSETSAIAEPHYRTLRISCWLVALVLGGLQAWATRFTMNPDGVSYLDIGDAYWRGDWHHAINAYWSPLYSWILGFFLKVLKPSAYWEYPLVHFVNFLIFLATLACFEFFLVSFIPRQQRRNKELAASGEIGISDCGWYLLAYSLFIWTTLVLVGVWVVTPDMLVFMFVCLDCALLLRLHDSPERNNYLSLGVALGLGYLAKSILFPLGIIFLVSTAFSKKTYRGVIVGAAIFLAIASPFIAFISYAKHRLTFGDSGRITYAAYISNLEPWFPGDGGDFYPEGIGHAENIDKPSQFSQQLLHPAEKIFDDPATYFFAGPVGGTYPFWYDVSYWQDGIRPGFRLSRELQALEYAGLNALLLFFGPSHQLVVTLALLFLFVLVPRPSTSFAAIAKLGFILVPIVIASVLYATLHFEFRYVAPFVCVGWMVLFSGIRLPVSGGLRLLIQLVIVLVAIWQTGITLRSIIDSPSDRRLQHPNYAEAAQALRQESGGDGYKIALISDEPLGKGGPFVARLAGAKIVAQVNSPSKFWEAPASAQSGVLEALAGAGTDAVLSWEPQNPTAEWQQLGSTPYFVLRLQSKPKNRARR